MGNSSSKRKSDDGCIGNRKVRTIIISVILIAFFVFGMAYFEANKSYYAKLADATDIDWFGIGQTCDTCEDLANAWLLVMIGAVTCACATIAALLFFLIPGCDDKMGTMQISSFLFSTLICKYPVCPMFICIGRIAGLALFLGGIVYIAGWIWIVKVEKDQYDPYWDVLTDDLKQQLQSKC